MYQHPCLGLTWYVVLTKNYMWYWQEIICGNDKKCFNMNLNYIANKCFCMAAKSWRKRYVNRNRPTTQLQIEIESHNLHEPNILGTFWYSIFVMLKHVYMYCMKYIWCFLPLKKNHLWHLIGANRYFWYFTAANRYLWCLMRANKYFWCSTCANIYL